MPVAGIVPLDVVLSIIITLVTTCLVVFLLPGLFFTKKPKTASADRNHSSSPSSSRCLAFATETCLEFVVDATLDSESLVQLETIDYPSCSILVTADRAIADQQKRIEDIERELEREQTARLRLEKQCDMMSKEGDELAAKVEDADAIVQTQVRLFLCLFAFH